MNMLPFCLAHTISDTSEKPNWLIDKLWSDQAVGILGGEPKCCKTFLALDMAVSVASGRPCLRCYPVANPGLVLLFAAEDSLPTIRLRLLGICQKAGVSLDSLDIQVITAPALRLDHQADRERLEITVAHLRPRLLILDPFIRLHRIDENVSGEVAPLLAFLRELQRRFQLAVVVVHHAKKAAGQARGGQALRGTSEFHAWGDSNIYLRRHRDDLILSTEHRFAPSLEKVFLQLEQNNNSLALGIINKNQESSTTLSRVEIIKQVLAKCLKPMSRAELRTACHMRTATIGHLLNQLVVDGSVKKTIDGHYCLSSKT